MSDDGESETCACGKPAEWVYMPAGELDDPYFCDGCLPRGCTCNWREVANEAPEGEEGYDWDYVVDKRVEPRSQWQPLDHKRRVLPCCEFDPLHEPLTPPLTRR